MLTSFIRHRSRCTTRGTGWLARSRTAVHLLFVAVLAAGVSAVASRSAAAQTPITVSISPSGGTFSSASLQVTIVFCDYNTTLTPSNTTITFNGAYVTSSFTESGYYCNGISAEKYVGTVTLTQGSNTLQASTYDGVTGTSTGTASYTYTPAPPPTPLSVSFANLNNDDQQLGLCAASCFAPALSHSTVAYRSLGVNRAVTLLYHGDRTAVRPVITADLTMPSSGGAMPDTITMQATVNGGAVTFVNGEQILHFSTTGLQNSKTYRIAGQFNAQGDATGMLSLQITVTVSFSDGTRQQYTTPAGTKLMVVNLSQTTGSVLPLRGWTVAGVQQLYLQGDTTALIVEGDGSGVYFNCAMRAYNTCQGPSGDFSSLTYDGVQYTRTYPNQSKVFFNSNGQMTSAKDRWGNTVTYAYDGSGRLSTVHDPLSSAYTRIGYGTSATPVDTILPPGANGAAPDVSRALEVTFDGNGNVTAFIDPGGGQTTLTYDASGRVSTVTDRRQGVTTFGYDGTTWKVTSITLPAVPIDQGGGTTTNESPVLHFKPWQTLAVPLSATGSTPAPAAELDTAFALTVGAVNDTTRFTADRWGQSLVSKDPLGNTTTIQRTGIFVTSITDALGHTSTYQYSGAFLTVAKPWANGKTDTTSYHYDGYGMADTVKSTNGPTISSFYASSIRAIVQAIAGGYQDTTWLDSRGRDSVHIDPRRHTQWMYYDAQFGNPDSVAVQDSVGRMVSQTIFDGFGRDSVIEGTNVPTVTKTYDKLGRLTSQYAYAGAQPTRFYYDSLFLVRTVDPAGQVHKTDLNTLGWPTVVYDAGDTTKSQKFFYDVGGRVTTAQNRRGISVAMTYDVAGRLLTKQGESPYDSLKYVYQYSPTNQVIAGLTENLSNTVISADTVWSSYAGADSSATWVAGKRFSRVHSATQGMLVDTTALSYTSGGSPVASVPLNTRIDSLSAYGVPSWVKLGGQTISFGYDGDLLLNSIGYGGYIASLTRNAQHKVTLRTYNDSTLDSLYGRRYEIDPYSDVGRITSEWWRSGSSSGEAVYTTRDFTYSAGTGTLGTYYRGYTQTTGTPGSYVINDTGYDVMSFDGVYNLTSDQNKNGTTISATYLPGDRVKTWNGVTYYYDADGNRDSTQASTGTTYYRWNADGQLVGIQRGTSSVWYDYDAFGQLFRRTTNGTIDRHFLWDRGQIVLEVDGAGTSKIGEYAYLGTNRPLAMWTGTNTSPYNYALDDHGDVVGSWTGPTTRYNRHFTPWGVEEAGDSISEAEKFGWKGLAWEGGLTQLYYVQNRWYDPKSRSFISEDPIGLAGGLNTYAYADNEQVQGWDPSGLTAIADLPSGCYLIEREDYNGTTSYWAFPEDQSQCGGGDPGPSTPSDPKFPDLPGNTPQGPSHPLGGPGPGPGRGTNPPPDNKPAAPHFNACYAVHGVIDLGLGVGKIGLAALGVETGPLAWYAAYSGVGNLASGASELYGAFSGNHAGSEHWSNMAASAFSVSGAITLIVTHNAQDGATAAQIEGLALVGVTGGLSSAGAIEQSSSSVSHVVGDADNASTFAGFVGLGACK